MSLEVNDQYDFFKQVRLNNDGKLIVTGLSGAPAGDTSYVLHSVPDMFNILKTNSSGTSLVKREITGIPTNSYTVFIVSALYYDKANDLLFAGLAGSSTYGSIWKSTDRGLTWTVVGPVDSASCQHINYNGTTYVAVGGTTSNQYGYYSLDGNTWTVNNLLARNLRQTAYSPELGLWVAIGTGSSSAPYLASSPDGITWTTRTDPWAVNRESWCVAYSPTLQRFVIGSRSAANGNPFGYSDNGTTWTEVIVPTTTIGNVSNIIWDPINELFIASGQTGTTNYERLIYSADGINWSVGTGYTLTNTVFSTYILNLYYDVENSKVVAFNGYRCYESSDGIAWTTSNKFSMYTTSESYKNNYTYVDLT